MKYFDYERLDDNVDPALRTFLLSLYHQDTLRRAMVAFPEFFTESDPGAFVVSIEDVATRYRALSKEDGDFTPERTELTEAVLSWFGIPVFVHEQRADRIPPSDGSSLLPTDFTLEHQEGYNGFTDIPWITELSVNGRDAERHLVLDVLMTGHENPSFFIWTVPTGFIEV